jgi:hypothetical protein
MTVVPLTFLSVVMTATLSDAQHHSAERPPRVLASGDHGLNAAACSGLVISEHFLGRHFSAFTASAQALLCGWSSSSSLREGLVSSDTLNCSTGDTFCPDLSWISMPTAWFPMLPGSRAWSGCGSHTTGMNRLASAFELAARPVQQCASRTATRV